MGQWIEVIVPLHPGRLEDLAGGFFQLGCEGISEETGRFILYFAADRWDQEKLLMLAERIRLIEPAFDAQQLILQNLPDQDWNENWKAYFKPLHLPGDLHILPDWEAHQATPQGVNLIIRPQMAFGTGHHETTRLALQFLQHFVRPGCSLLDAGTGSGILAIYAAKRGASPIRAFDNDPLALANARDNMRLNGVGDKIRLFQGTISEMDRERYDVIVANINRNVLLEWAAKFREYMVDKGILILSGILDTDKDAISACYREAGWKLKQKQAMNEWLSMVWESA